MTESSFSHTLAEPAYPVRVLRLRHGRRPIRLQLHLNGANPFGSVKYRTAEALLRSFERTGQLRPGGHVVESTSGNLGIALAGLCAERGYRCTLAVDDSTAPFSLSQMATYGAELVHVMPTDARYGVNARLDAVRAFLAAHPDAIWTDQYNNPAGPAAHAETTGPAMLHPSGLPPPQALMVPVSTGGVLAGVATCARAYAPDVRVWAVDAVGSAAAGGTAAPRPDKLPGFGSALRSTFLTGGQFDGVAYVADTDAAATCRLVRRQTGISLGGSAGAAVLAAIRVSRADDRLSEIACLCPDGGDRYEQLVYGTEPSGSPLVSGLEHLAWSGIERDEGSDEFFAVLAQHGGR